MHEDYIDPINKHLQDLEEGNIFELPLNQDYVSAGSEGFLEALQEERTLEDQELEKADREYYRERYYEA